VSKRSLGRWLGFGTFAVIAAGCAYLLLGRGESAASDSSPPPPAPVTAAAVSTGDVPIELEGLGRVQAFNTVIIRSLISGPVKSIDFADGQTVQAGAMLAQIDPRPLQATVDQDKATIARDQASVSNAEADLRRYVPLAGQGIVSVQQVTTQRSVVAQLHATVAADMAALTRDQVQLSYTNIAAPLAGVLGLRLVDVGNTVSPTDPGGIVVLTQILPIDVLFPIPQANLPEVQLRQTAAGATGLSVEAWTQDGSRKLDEGRLSALSNQVDIVNGTVTLKATFPNVDRTLWPGASITAHLVLDTKHNGLTVPASALDQGPGGSFVWVIGQDGKVKPTPVQGQQLINGISLLTGLKAGERVVTNGQYGLTDGAAVAVQESKSSDAADGSAAKLRSNQAGRLGISP
jgi:membrane fusion protein, multidrug efflux system